MPIDRLHNIPVRPAPGSPLGLRLENEKLKKESEILQKTSAFHGIFTLPPESSTITLTFLNPALRQEIKLLENSPISDYLGNKLRTSVVTHNWEEEPTISFVTSIDSPELGQSDVFGLTVEKIENGQYHLTGRNITNKEIIRQQKEKERTHDSLTGYLNSAGSEKLFKEINDEKRELLKPKNITLFYIDLARVREINNTINHEAGDKHIVETFKLIANTCFRENDIFIRIHNTGDELVVLLPNVDQENTNKIIDRLNSLRQINPEHRFYFGHATGTPGSSDKFDFSAIISEADNKQIVDKNLIKSSYGQRH